MEIAPSKLCCGCGACQAACSYDAIKMLPDNEGFLRPFVDATKCKGCACCKKVCPILQPGESREPLAVYAAMAMDDNLRFASSSGGIFSLIARCVIEKGGIVFGAGWDRSTWRVVHKSVDSEEGLSDLRGAKYVQSDMTGVHVCIKHELIKGRVVLFSGTPCQVASIRLFLGKDYGNLILLDVVCHAVPSPLAWQRFLAEKLSNACSYGYALPGDSGNLRQVSFRHKIAGWRNYSLLLQFADNTEYLQEWTNCSFLRGFNGELYNRPSCHVCHCRELRSGSDLTIADYWRVHESFPEMDDGKGTSLVLINTSKGKRVWGKIKILVNSVRSDYKDATRINPALIKSSPPSGKRSWFFSKMVSGEGFESCVSRGLQRPLLHRIYSWTKRVIVGF